MNIGILYGRDINEESEDAEVAASVYDADQVLFVDEITLETLAGVKSETGCKTETVLVVTNDDLSDMGLLRRLYAGCLQLAFVQSVSNLRANYRDMYQIN